MARKFVKSDTELIVRARSGDKAAFDELFGRSLPYAERIAQSIVGSPDLAQELVQEAMVQVYLSLPHLQNTGRFQSWLHGIIRNVCHNHLRSHKIGPVSWDALIESQHPTAPGADILVEADELRQSIRIAVAKLAPGDQAAILLFYYEQNNTAEIAAVLRISIEAVRVRLHRARKQLEGPLLHLHSGVNSGKKRKMTLITMGGGYDLGLEVKPPVTGKYQEERRLAEAALAKYGIQHARVTLHGRPRNAESQLPLQVEAQETGQQFVLRAYRLEQFGPKEIASEMMWLQALRRDIGTFFPEPVPNTAGTFVTDPEVDGRLCAMTAWVPGRTIGSGIGPRRANSFGTLMARMHLHSETWTPPAGFSRPRYDLARMSRFMPAMEAGIATGRITEYAYGVFQAFFDLMDKKLREMGTEPAVWGMIHSDIHDENRVCFRNDVRPIDFTECGFGYYMYDIAQAMISMFPDERKTFYEGYASTRPLPADYEDQMMHFLSAAIIGNQYYHGFVSGEQPDPAGGYDGLARRIEQAHLIPFAPARPDLYDDYAGRYDLAPEKDDDDAHYVDISRDGDRLIHERVTWPKYEIFPIEGGLYFEKNWAWKYEFSRDEAGQVVSFAQISDHRRKLYVRRNAAALTVN